MSKRTLLSLMTLLIALVSCLSAFGQSGRRPLLAASTLKLTDSVSEREQDGLNGPVRRVRTETAKLSNKNGKLVEAARVTLEVAAYDIKGAKVENAYYPVSGAAVTGKEVYKYDDKGNIIEMILQDEKGTLLSKETYTYEFDQFGNWTKMTTAVAVIENGKITFEPTEVTYRSISYYLDEATLAKMSQPAAPSPNASAANNAAASGAPNNASVPATNTASNGTTPNSTQPPQTQASKPATTDASKQAATQPTLTPSASSSAAPIVKTSATVSDKAVSEKQPGPSPEQKSAGTVAKTAAAKPADDQAAKPVAKPLLKPVSGGVLNGKAVNLPKPTYPLTARTAKITGVVIVEVVIDVNGKVISARPLSGPVLLQQSAVQAAYQAKFSPTILSGQPVKVVGTINYNFLTGQ